MLQHNKARYQPFWSDPLNPIFCLYLLFFLAGTLRSLPVQVRLLFVLAAAHQHLLFYLALLCYGDDSIPHGPTSASFKFFSRFLASLSFHEIEES